MINPGLSYRGRHLIAYGAFTLLFGGLALRAAYLTVIDSDFLRRQGDARMLRTEPVMAMRGMISDRNGTPLAVSTPVISIWINPRQALAEGTDIAAVARALDMDPNELVSRVRRNAHKSFLYVRRQLPPPVAAAFLKHDFPGVSDMTEYQRFYPEAESTAHIIGFTNLDDHGQEGLELALDKELTGEQGLKRVVKDRKGHRVQDVALIKPARPGKDIELSFDSRVQYVAYRELARGVADKDAKAGILVSLDVDTGEVLAMANVPSYNPNNREKLTPDALRNRAVTDMFEPGSTMKPFTLAAALESGKYTPQSRFNTNPGWIRVLNRVVHDDDNLGDIDMTTILTKSSNVASTMIAMSLPRDTLPHMHERMGFGHPTGSGFPGESAGRLQPPDRWNPVEVATMAYGYGVTVTALQLARAYAAIASGGIERPISFLKVDSPVPGKRVLSEKIAHTLITMMETVVTSDGTALKAAVPGYSVAGKTGTAHKAVDGGYAANEYMSLFVGMAPASHPKVVTVVVIDTARTGSYFGGQAAAPIFSRFMADTLRLMNIAPDRSSERLADQPAVRPVMASRPNPVVAATPAMAATAAGGRR